MSDIILNVKTRMINAVLAAASKAIPYIDHIKIKCLDSCFWCKGKVSYITFKCKGKIEFPERNLCVITISVLKCSHIKLPRGLILKKAIQFLNKKLMTYGVNMDAQSDQVIVDAKQINIPVAVDDIILDDHYITVKASLSSLQYIEKIIMKLLRNKAV